MINLGTLVVNNTQALGTGDVIVNGGTLSADPQRINVLGNYAQNPGGTLQLQVAGATLGQYDSLNVVGNAALNGTLQLINLGFRPVAGNALTLVTAGGFVSGQFAKFGDPFTVGGGVGSILLLYAAHTVILEFSAALPPPGTPIVPVVPAPPLPPGVPEVPIVPVVPISISQVDPGSVTSVYTVGFADANIQLLDLEDRLDAVRAGCGGFSSNLKINAGGKELVDGKSVREPVVEPIFQSGCDNRWGVWATGSGDFVTVDGDANAKGYNSTGGGVTLGLDYRITDYLVIGVVGAYSHSWTGLQPAGHIDMNNGQGGLYGTWYDRGIYVNGGISGGHNTYEISRTTIAGLTNGSTEGLEWSAFIGGGYDFHWGNLTAGPIASLQYISVSLDEFTETASLAPLDIHSNAAESLRSDLGFRAFFQWQVGKVVLRPSLRATWEHEYKYSAFPIVAGFAGFPQTSQTFFGPKMGQDSAVVSVGLTAQLTPAISVYANYDGQLGRYHYDSNAVTGGFSMSF